LRIRLLNLLDGGFLHRDAAVLIVAELYDHVLVRDINDDAVETARRQYAVAYRYGIDQRGSLLLLLLLRTVEQEIENSDMIAK